MGLVETGSGRQIPVFLTSVEVADLLKVTARTVENWRLEGRGPRYIRLAREGVGRVVYNLRDVEEWVARHAVG